MYIHVHALHPILWTRIQHPTSLNYKVAMCVCVSVCLCVHPWAISKLCPCRMSQEYKIWHATPIISQGYVIWFSTVQHKGQVLTWQTYLPVCTPLHFSANFPQSLSAGCAVIAASSVLYSSHLSRLQWSQTKALTKKLLFLRHFKYRSFVVCFS